MNVRALLFASFLLAGCGSSADSSTPVTDAGSDGTADTGGSDTAIVSETSSDTSADACSACLSSELSWGMDGGEVAFLDRSTLKGCNDYHRSRTGSTPLMCDAKIPTCPGDVPDADFVTGVNDVESAIANDEVIAALTKAPVLYGKDSRPVDGQVFQVVVGDRKIEIGSDCAGASGCTDAPAGVLHLRDVLKKIDAEKNLTACSAFK